MWTSMLTDLKFEKHSETQRNQRGTTTSHTFRPQVSLRPIYLYPNLKKKCEYFIFTYTYAKTNGDEI